MNRWFSDFCKAPILVIIYNNGLDREKGKVKRELI